MPSQLQFKIMKNFTSQITLNETHEIIEMALSDNISFSDIRELYGLRENDVKRSNAKKSKTCKLRSLAQESSKIFKQEGALQMKSIFKVLIVSFFFSSLCVRKAMYRA